MWHIRVKRTRIGGCVSEPSDPTSTASADSATPPTYHSRYNSVCGMDWGEIETEPEFDAWYFGLNSAESATVDRHVDRLARDGVHLGEPHTRQLSGKLRELRFHLGDDQVRVSYYIATGRRIILLTVFPKSRPRER